MRDLITKLRKRFEPRTAKLGYVAMLVWFGSVLAGLYEPGAGFSYLITFGAAQELPQLPELRRIDHYVQSDGAGYDAQYYAQIAMHPGLREPALREATDNLPYRARRILLGWSAYAFGFGRPAWILQAYAVQNIVAWLALAAVLLRWFPPVSWSNLLRWAGVLASAGVCLSVRHALIDGPSLLLIALGVWCVEARRPWLAAGVLGVAGLAKETNLLGATMLAEPARRDRRSLGRLVLQGVLVVAPLGAWLLYVHVAAGAAVDVGTRNFDVPLVGYFGRWRETVGEWIQAGGRGSRAWSGVWIIVALTAQALFLLLRPRPGEVWWRVGTGFAVLMVVLGTAVWEGYPGAAARVLLPMQLAFNVLVPRGGRWLAVLVLGNLTVLTASDCLRPPPGHGYRLTGPGALTRSADGATQARVIFDAAWYQAERSGSRVWRWARGDATFVVVNPGEQPVRASLHFHLDALDRREAKVARDGRVLWAGAIAKGGREIGLADVELAPGENGFEITTERPPHAAGGRDGRLLAFSLRDLAVRFEGVVPGGGRPVSGSRRDVPAQ